MKGQTPFPGGRCSNSTDHGPSAMFGFNSRSADDLFSELFGFRNPFVGVGCTDDPRAAAYGFSRGLFGDDKPGSSRRGAGAASGNMTRKNAAIEKTLLCSLKDLYNGSAKKMKISKDVMDASGLVSIYRHFTQELIYL